MQKPRVIDANIILRFLTDDDPIKAAACEALLLRVEAGQEEIYLPDLILADIIWTLEKYYRVDKNRIREMITPILAIKGLICSGKGRALSALATYTAKNIDWTDAFIAAEMADNGQAEIYSYDHDFDRFPEIGRLEP